MLQNFVFVFMLLVGQISWSAPHNHSDHDHGDHQGHHHGHHHDHDHGPLNEEQKVVAETMEFFHDAISGAHEEHSHSLKDFFVNLSNPETWRSFIRGLNPSQVAANTYRAYYMGAKSRDVLNMAQDFVLLYPLAHGVESTLGPSLGFLAHEFGLSHLASSMVGVVGGIIAIPGFDPICILLYSSYVASPAFRNSVGYFRRGAVQVAYGTWYVGKSAGNLAATATGAKALYRQLKTVMDSNYRSHEGAQWEFADYGSQWKLEWKKDAEHWVQIDGFKNKSRFDGDPAGTYVTSVTWRGDEKPSFRFLPWNVRKAIKNAYKDQPAFLTGDGSRRRFYVRSHVELAGDANQVLFLPHSVPLTKGLEHHCDWLLDTP